MPKVECPNHIIFYIAVELLSSPGCSWMSRLTPQQASASTAALNWEIKAFQCEVGSLQMFLKSCRNPEQNAINGQSEVENLFCLWCHRPSRAAFQCAPSGTQQDFFFCNSLQLGIICFATFVTGHWNLGICHPLRNSVFLHLNELFVFKENGWGAVLLWRPWPQTLVRLCFSIHL